MAKKSGKSYGVEEIHQILKEADQNVCIEDVLQKYEVSLSSYYTWKQKYTDMGPSGIHQLKILNLELGRLKKLLAAVTLENVILKEINSKK